LTDYLGKPLKAAATVRPDNTATNGCNDLNKKWRKHLRQEKSKMSNAFGTQRTAASDGRDQRMSGIVKRRVPATVPQRAFRPVKARVMPYFILLPWPKARWQGR
jgi:hypothetical protein